MRSCVRGMLVAPSVHSFARVSESQRTPRTHIFSVCGSGGGGGGSNGAMGKDVAHLLISYRVFSVWLTAVGNGQWAFGYTKMIIMETWEYLCVSKYACPLFPLSGRMQWKCATASAHTEVRIVCGTRARSFVREVHTPRSPIHVVMTPKSTRTQNEKKNINCEHSECAHNLFSYV